MFQFFNFEDYKFQKVDSLGIKVDKPSDHHKKTREDSHLDKLRVEGRTFPSAVESNSFIPSDDGTLSLIFT